MTYHYKGLDVEISVSGQGAPLLLLHGWGCDHKIFAHCVEYMSQSYRVYAFDLPGFGLSAEPNEVWGTQDYVDMLHSFVLDNSLSAPTLAGHSFGGRLSILYASLFECDRIILIDAAGIVPTRSWSYYRKVYSFKLLKAFCNIFLPNATAQRIIDKRRGSSGSSDYRDASPRMRAILSKAVNEDLKSVMARITAPTLLFWGDRDTATPISDARTMERLIPNTKLVVASGCGHYAFLESKGLFDAVVKKFLEI